MQASRRMRACALWVADSSGKQLGKGTREVRPIHTLLLVACLSIAHLGAAQSTPDQGPPPTSKLGTSLGPTAFVQYGGNSFNMGAITALTVNVGYDFTSHIGGDIGLPLYSSRSPFSLVNDKDWRYTTVIGSPYIDLRYTTKTTSGVNMVSVLTLSGGTRSVRTYSTGRGIVDWYNHFDRSYELTVVPVVVTPFVNFGAATGTFDRAVLATPYNVARPYQTLGALGDGEAGASFTFRKRYKLNGSIYGLAPVGSQKVFSRLVAPDSLIAADDFSPTSGLPAHGRYWNDFYETGGAVFGNTEYNGGPARIARDNGYSAWLEVTRFKHVSIEIGYTRSVHYAYDSGFIMIKYDLSRFLRSVTTGE